MCILRVFSRYFVWVSFCFVSVFASAFASAAGLVTEWVTAPVYDAEMFEFPQHWEGASLPLEIKAQDTASARFRASESFSKVTVSCPSYSNHIGSLRLSLFRWTDSFEKTLASEPLLRQTFKDFPDNSPLTLSISPETPFSPGEYLFVLDQAVERVGVWTQSDHPGQAQCFFNGKPIPRGFRFTWSRFGKAPFPFRGTQEAYELASAPCPYPPEMQDNADDADDPIVKFDVQPDRFAAMDDLGRTLPDQTSAGPVRAGKQVGIFYSTWHQKDHGGRTRVYDNTQILRENPGIENRPEDPAWGEYYQHHYWGKPLFGYYKTTDKWVLRKHAQMLANAQIDMVAFDCTNGSHTWMDSTWALLETWADARKDGVNTPKIVFMLPFWDRKHNAISIRQLYRDIYRDGKYRELWFYWQGKPLIYAISDVVDEKIVSTSGAEKEEWKAIRRFFTFRLGQPRYAKELLPPDNWAWLQIYPQRGFGKREDGTFEMTCVSVAQNHSLNKYDGTFGVAAMNDRDVFGRAWQMGKGLDPRPDAFKFGLNFEQQWDRAFQIDPDLVFVTGWNEWTAMRFPEWRGLPNAFPDQYDQHFSRDVEPCDGELRDIYYHQLAAKVRQFKGVRPVSTFGKTVSIPFERKSESTAASGSSENRDSQETRNQWENADPWDAVEPVFRDYRGDIQDRNAEGAGGLLYTNRSGRNDIVISKVARDETYVYFMAETASALTSRTDRNWMQLFLSVDDDPAAPSWHGFQYLVNRNTPGDRAVLERSTGGWNWERTGDAELRITGNRLELRIRRSDLGLSPDKPIRIRFKWADNGFRPEDEDSDTPDILDFHQYGDAAPDGRFAFQIREEE